MKRLLSKADRKRLSPTGLKYLEMLESEYNEPSEKPKDVITLEREPVPTKVDWTKTTIPGFVGGFAALKNGQKVCWGNSAQDHKKIQPNAMPLPTHGLTKTIRKNVCATQGHRIACLTLGDGQKGAFDTKAFCLSCGLSLEEIRTDS